MATDLENIQARRSAILAELAALDTTKLGGLPNAQGSGHTIDHQGYKKGLLDELKQLNELVTALGGPWEVLS